MSIFNCQNEVNRFEKFIWRFNLSQEVGDRKDSCEAMTFDSRGNLYFGLLTQGSLMTWNVTDPPIEKQAEVVLQNAERLVWINSIFISEGSIWIVTNKLELK
jgi:hypothetical protein